MFGSAGMLYISQDWIEADYSDDNLFEILFNGGKALSKTTGDEQTIEAANWDILRAEELV